MLLLKAAVGGTVCVVMVSVLREKGSALDGRWLVSLGPRVKRVEQSLC